MLFTLWGDYVVQRGGELSVGSLLRIGAEFGLSELALRSVLARMSRAGWLRAQRRGIRSYYNLTRRGRALIAEGTARIFRPRDEPWDGQWHLVSYSIPERARERRDEFRKRLTYLGFGSLAPGAWITPHDLRAEVGELTAELSLTAHVEQFRGLYLGPHSGPALAARVWPLERLGVAYHDFLSRWRPIAQRGDIGLDDARAFVLRFSLIHEYQRFFLEDPDLPAALTPADWPGRAAAELFESLHARLGPGANRFFDQASGADAEPASPDRDR